MRKTEENAVRKEGKQEEDKGLAKIKQTKRRTKAPQSLHYTLDLATFLVNYG